jgi:hypothetical protein
MANIEAVQALSRQAEVSLYLCIPAENSMKTFHEGKVYDGDLPDWMRDFITGDSPVLHFENEGQRQKYVRWKLGDSNTIVFLDDERLSNLSKLLNRLLDAPSASMTASELKLLQDKHAKLKIDLDVAQKRNKSDAARISALEAELSMLKEQNADQAARLKEAYTKNREGLTPLQTKLMDGFKQ